MGQTAQVQRARHLASGGVGALHTSETARKRHRKGAGKQPGRHHGWCEGASAPANSELPSKEMLTSLRCTNLLFYINIIYVI